MTTERTGLARRYVHRVCCLMNRDEELTVMTKWEADPYMMTPIVVPFDDGPVDAVHTTVTFKSDEPWCILQAAKMCIAVWRGIVDICDNDEAERKARIVADAHAQALAELEAGTLPEVTEPEP